MKLVAALLALITSVASNQPAPIEPATMVLRNGKIVTVDDSVPEAQADRDPRRPHRRGRQQRRDPALHRTGDEGDRSRRAARDPGTRREPRPLHGLRPVEDDARSDGREGLERDRLDGGGRGEAGQAGRVDHRTRLASGKVGERPATQRRRLSVSRRAQQGVAEQSGDADARQRPRQLRQRHGDGGGGADREDAGSGGRRDPQGQERAGRSACCAKPPRASSAARSTRGARRKRRRSGSPMRGGRSSWRVQASLEKASPAFTMPARTSPPRSLSSRRLPTAASASACG